MQRQIPSYFYLFLSLLVPIALCPAQSIEGTVHDSSGAPVRGATVQLLSATRLLAKTKSSASGAFSLAPPRGATFPDGFAVQALASGFEPSRTEIALSQVGVTNVALVLHLAPYRQSVEIHASVPADDAILDLSGVRESAAKDLGEAATALDGVWKIRKAGIANDLVIRGFQQGNINVLVDGSRTYGACPSHMDPPAQHVDFAQVDHVEVKKGAFDVTNQGSLGAVVNIVTKSPGMGFHFKPSLSTGSFGFFNPSATASYGNKRFRILGGYSYRSSDPYHDGSGRSLTDYAPYSANGSRQRSYDIHTGWLETQFQISERQQLSLGYTRQQAGLILYPYLMRDSDHDNADRGTFRYAAQDLTSTLRNLRVEAYFTQVKHFMSDSQRSSSMMGNWMMAADASSRALGGRIETDLGQHFTWGVETYHRNWDVLGYMHMNGTFMLSPSIPDVGTQSLGSFLTFERPITETVRVTAGARFDHAQTRVGVANAPTNLYYQFHGTRRTEATDNYASGNVRLSVAMPHATDFYLGVGTTGRIPDAEERFISRGMGSNVTVGNPTLPITRNTELSAGWNLNSNRFYLRPALFYSFLNDFVLVNRQVGTSAPSAGGGMVMDPIAGMAGSDMGGMASPDGMEMERPAIARSFSNVDARIYGGELGYGLTLTQTLSLNGGASYTRGTALSRPGASALGGNLPEMPPLRGWGALRYARRRLFAEFGSTAVHRQSLVNRNLSEVPTPGYLLLNAKLGFTLDKFSASVSVDNLTDRFYYEHLAYFRDPFAAGVKIPEPGRNVFLQLRYNF